MEKRIFDVFSFLSHLQQRPAPGLWAQINYQNITKTNKIMITNCQAIADLPKTKFKSMINDNKMNFQF